MVPPEERHAVPARTFEILAAAHAPDRVARAMPVVVAVVAVAVVVVSVLVGVTRYRANRAAASPTTTAVRAVDAAAQEGPLAVVTTTPAAGATDVPTDATVSVHFSVPLDPHSPTPSLTPAVAGAWQEITRTPSPSWPPSPFVPSSHRDPHRPRR